MSYKENLYNKALHEIERIYVESKYDSDMDFYRIFDIINSINDNQMANKEWLVDMLLPYIDPKGADICILGGWYGLTALMLRQHLPEEIEIDNVDCDIWCSRIARRLNDGAKNIRYATDNAEDWFFDKPRKYQLIINTSCEHMEQDDLNLMIGLKKKEAIICLQGNNYHEIQSHINTHNSLEEFVESFKLNEILFQDTLPSPCGKYDRYMVIGK